MYSMSNMEKPGESNIRSKTQVPVVSSEERSGSDKATRYRGISESLEEPISDCAETGGEGQGGSIRLCGLP